MKARRASDCWHESRFMGKSYEENIKYIYKLNPCVHKKYGCMIHTPYKIYAANIRIRNQYKYHKKTSVENNIF